MANTDTNTAGSALTLARDLKGMTTTKVITDTRVRNQFAYIYNSVHGDGGEAAYDRESLYFVQQIQSNPALQKCSGPSVYYSFIDLAVKGLSLQPGSQAQCYLLPRSVRTGKDDRGNDVWETTCSLTISGYGELALRKAAGQILHADNPVIVYEGDFFEFGETDGRKFVNYRATFPRSGNRIVACFVKITRADGSTDYSVMTEPDWMRLADYSKKQNRGRVNDLYASNNGQIDAGFLIAKTVKHAFRTYPRIAVGLGSALAADAPDDQTALDPYGGVAEAVEAQNRKGNDAPRQEARQTNSDDDDLPFDGAQAPAEPEDFAPARDLSGGVRVKATDDDDLFF